MKKSLLAIAFVVATSLSFAQTTPANPPAAGQPNSGTTTPKAKKHTKKGAKKATEKKTAAKTGHKTVKPAALVPAAK